MAEIRFYEIGIASNRELECHGEIFILILYILPVTLSEFKRFVEIFLLVSRIF